MKRNKFGIPSGAEILSRSQQKSVIGGNAAGPRLCGQTCNNVTWALMCAPGNCPICAPIPGDDMRCVTKVIEG